MISVITECLAYCLFVVKSHNLSEEIIFSHHLSALDLPHNLSSEDTGALTSFLLDSMQELSNFGERTLEIFQQDLIMS